MIAKMRDLLAQINGDRLNLKLTFSKFISKPKSLIQVMHFLIKEFLHMVNTERTFSV